jgi:Uma2 family endonuclease
MTAKPLHQRTLNFLNHLLDFFARFFDLGQVFIAPTQMKLSPTGAGREPDIMFVAREHLDRVLENRLDGPADLVVEIISDDSVSRDLDEKFFEYQDAGVLEYWVIDPRPRRKRALFYRLDEQGQYQSIPVGADGIYRSLSLPGFWFNVNWLWQKELPDPQMAFAEIAGFSEQIKTELARLRKK